ncbi:hypothetical protein SCACP_33310 [Sporomusa carbonis]|uniref:spore germination protein n=1 Tax=Sporomusa carbonis TaxID=3076075 RepID=UPI003A6E9004
MENNTLFKAYRFIKNTLTYQPPSKPKPFVLSENKHDQGSDIRKDTNINAEAQDGKAPLKQAAKEMRSLLEHARDVEQALTSAKDALGREWDAEKIPELKQKLAALEKRQVELRPVLRAYDTASRAKDRAISASLSENEQIVHELYSLPLNMDLMVRKFDIPCTPPLKGMLVFIDGLVDKQVINLAILQPLMLFGNSRQLTRDGDIGSKIVEHFLPSNQAKQVETFAEVANGVNSGDTAIFFDGVTQAIIVETKGYAHRGVERPEIEQSVTGAQAGFSEALRVNTGLIRTLLPTADLVTEIKSVGNRAPTMCAVMYLKSVANPELVDEIKRRLDGVSTDYVIDMGMLEQFIEDQPSVIFPQSLITERADRVAVHLAEGRVAILLAGSPFAMIVPINFFTFFHFVEDFSLKVPAGSFMRMVRLVGTLLAVITPSLYLAVAYFHQEALPTQLALAIAAAREKVPFPAIFEILFMELSFELIREAGLRVPGVLGSTIGIVGAIILGQAAVAANLVSPIMVVIIALTGLASFTIPDYRMAFSLRVARFAFLGLATVLGLVGVAIGLSIAVVVMCRLKSFGVPYMAPIGPKTIAGYDVVFRGSVFRQEKRPDALNPQDNVRQPGIAREWAQEPPVGKEDKS